jgi:hypothetical protein
MILDTPTFSFSPGVYVLQSSAVCDKNHTAKDSRKSIPAHTTTMPECARFRYFLKCREFLQSDESPVFAYS